MNGGRKRRAPRVGSGLFHMLGEAVENPQSGVAGKVFALLSVIMVVITVVSLCISTMPDQRQEETMVCAKQSRAVLYCGFNLKYITLLTFALFFPKFFFQKT